MSQIFILLQKIYKNVISNQLKCNNKKYFRTKVQTFSESKVWSSCDFFCRFFLSFLCESFAVCDANNEGGSCDELLALRGGRWWLGIRPDIEDERLNALLSFAPVLSSNCVVFLMLNIEVDGPENAFPIKGMKLVVGLGPKPFDGLCVEIDDKQRCLFKSTVSSDPFLAIGDLLESNWSVRRLFPPSLSSSLISLWGSLKVWSLL